MRALVLAASLLLLAGCAGRYCATDNSGVERSPWSAAPDARHPSGR